MGWYRAYYFEVTVHQVLIRYHFFFKDFLDTTLFPDNSSYRFRFSGQ